MEVFGVDFPCLADIPLVGVPWMREATHRNAVPVRLTAYFLKIFSIFLPFASSSTSLSR
jgi:hypothetical protein